MEYRVWISQSMETLIKAWTSDGPVYEGCAFFEHVDEEAVSLLMKFMQRQGCIIAIMPALTQEEE